MTYTGYLQLEASERYGKSVLSDAYYNGVFKISRPTYTEEGLPLVQLIHVGGGYVDGDTYFTKINVRKNAKLAVTTQASTKIYKTRNKQVEQKSVYKLDEKSQLHLKLDPLIAYRDARFIQQTDVYMDKSAVLFLTDIVTPGWSKEGELFPYTCVTSKVKIYQNEKLAVYDHLRLKPDEDVRSLLQLEGNTHIGSLFFIHPSVSEEWIETLREELSSFPDAHFGVSMLPIPGCCFRILAKRTSRIEKVFAAIETFIHRTINNQSAISWRK
ncbi:urease accessory protein UreD [Guptibacillus hwajinpoensis]|uniref:urease accessory protein UreD n=1 Tax=Guptibacillus hwajinpoensis TaxID=208199 RepID=UPI001CD70AA7|nr:urease accessory protein UreD [Pseudalkalibacillus hwajinpoensis]